jgi:hypothetical protein
MYPGFVTHTFRCDYAPYAMVWIDYLQIHRAHIERIAVPEAVVTAHDRVGMDAVTLVDRQLHAVIGDKVVSAAFHYGMCGIIEKLILVESEENIGTYVIVEEVRPYVDRICDINTVVAEIAQYHPFTEGKCAGALIAADDRIRIMKDVKSVMIGSCGGLCGFIASEADMFIMECY